MDALKGLLARDIEQSDKERKKLQKIMEQATALLTRNSADVGAQVDRIQAKSDRLGGQMEEQVKKLEDLSKAYDEFKAKVDVKLEGLAGGVTEPKGGSPPTRRRCSSWLQDRLAGGKHKDARRLARHFISNFPKDPRVHKAQLMLGESYYAEQKFAPAIVEYKKILDQHKSERLRAGRPGQDRHVVLPAQVLQRRPAPSSPSCSRRYKRHPQAPRARKVLKLIRSTSVTATSAAPS